MPKKAPELTFQKHVADFLDRLDTSLRRGYVVAAFPSQEQSKGDILIWSEK